MKTGTIKNITKYLVTALVLAGSLSTAQAFDGDRKGFQLGLGIGAHTSAVDNITGVNQGANVESERRLATAFHIGYGFTNQLTVFLGAKGGAVRMNDVDGSLAIAGFGATYYLSNSAPSLYLTGLAGSGSLTLETDAKDKDVSGSGWLVGVGYEFSPRVHLELTYGQAQLANVADENETTDLESAFATIQYHLY